MTTDPPGVASPRDPAGGPSQPAPRFGTDAERVERPAPGPKPRPPEEAPTTTAAPRPEPTPTTPTSSEETPPAKAPPRRVRARKVHRVVRHVDPWSVLKVSVLFFLAVFAIICVASAILWNGARSAGTIDKVEDFITDTGGFGNCPTPAEPEAPVTSTTAPATGSPPSTTVPPPEDTAEDDDQDCPDGAELEGAFEFEDGKIFQAFGLGGIVLVLAGSAGAVVLALLFNLMSDLTGGIRVTVLEEEPSASRPSRERPPS